MLTEWALNLELGQGPMLKRLLGFSLKQSNWQSVLVILVMLSGDSSRADLLWVNTQALGNKVHSDSIHLLDETCDWWQQLVDIVPVNVWHKSASRLHHFFKTEGCLLEREPSILVLLIIVKILTDHISNEVLDKLSFGLASLLDQSVGNDDMRKTLEVTVL